MPAKVNADECISCEACVDECPVGAISMDGAAVVNADECIDCEACVDACAVGAITIE